MNDINELLSAPRLERIKTALFIQPHPDDNQIAAGGLIARLIAMGAEVWELTVCDDKYVDLSSSDANGLTTRRREALRSQLVLGMKNAGFLGFADKTRATADEISQAILPVIRSIKPDAVFSADSCAQNECHSDHIKVGQAVRYACMDSDCNFYPSLDNGKLRTDAWRVEILGLYYTDTPNVGVDISEQFELKRDAVGAHRSQVSVSLMAAIGLMAEKWGESYGCEYAETFKIISNLHMHCYPFDIPGYFLGYR